MKPTFRLANDNDIEILMEFMRHFYAIDPYLFEEQAARRALEKIVHLEVEPTNAAGLSLYNKFGFEDHDRRLMTRWIEK